MAVWGVLGSLTLGIVLGLNAGYRGGWADQIIMQILDALIAFPRIILYLVVIAALGQGDLVVILAIAVTGAPGVARLVRSLAIGHQTRDYVHAAETRGESKWFVMLREILPNARGPILVDAMLRVGYAISPSARSASSASACRARSGLGNMVNEARRFIYANPWARALALTGNFELGRWAESVRRWVERRAVALPEVVRGTWCVNCD